MPFNSIMTESIMENYVKDAFQTIVKTVHRQEKREEKNEEGWRQPTNPSVLAGGDSSRSSLPLLCIILPYAFCLPLDY